MSDIDILLHKLHYTIIKTPEYQDYDPILFYEELRTSSTKLSSLSLDQSSIIYDILLSLHDYDFSEKDFIYEVLDSCVYELEELICEKLVGDIPRYLYENFCNICYNYLDISIQEHLFRILSKTYPSNSTLTINDIRTCLEECLEVCIKYVTDINKKDDKNMSILDYVKYIDRAYDTRLYDLVLELASPETKEPGFN